MARAMIPNFRPLVQVKVRASDGLRDSVNFVNSVKIVCPARKPVLMSLRWSRVPHAGEWVDTIPTSALSSIVIVYDGGSMVCASGQNTENNPYPAFFRDSRSLTF
jgi:hypothetical protein